jgi:hypothetical protein
MGPELEMVISPYLFSLPKQKLTFRTQRARRSWLAPWSIHFERGCCGTPNTAVDEASRDLHAFQDMFEEWRVNPHLGEAIMMPSTLKDRAKAGE